MAEEEYVPETTGDKVVQQEKEAGDTTYGSALAGVTEPEPVLTDMSEEKGEMSTALTGINTASGTAMSEVTGDEVSYEGVDADTLKTEASLSKGNTYITPESTVQGQLETLLDSNSEYMQNAEKRAKSQAASLGLLGSSMAAGATHRAAIESALPIAQQDAETYAQAALQEQQASNEISRMKAESDLSAVARDHIYDIDTAKTKLGGTIDVLANNFKQQGNAEIEAYLQQAKATWDADINSSLAAFDAQLQSSLANQEISAREREWASTNASQVMAAAYGSINDLLGNADFMASYSENTEGMNKVFNNFINFGKDQMAYIGATASIAKEYLGDEEEGDAGWIDLIGSWA